MQSHASHRYFVQTDLPDGTERTLYRYPNGFGVCLDTAPTNDRAVFTTIKWRGEFWSASGSAAMSGNAHPVGEVLDVTGNPAEFFDFLKTMLREVWGMPTAPEPDLSGTWQAFPAL